MSTIPEDQQITLSNKCEGLEPNSTLAKFAEKLQDDCSITLTPNEMKRLVKYINSLRKGVVASAPMICAGEICPYATKCPLGTNNTYPIGKACPIEGTLLEIWQNDYIKEMGIDPDSKVDGALVSDLVFWEVLEKRATEELAIKPGIVQKNLAGFKNTDKGLEPVYQDQLNPIVGFLEKAQRQKLKILQAMIATREAKAKDLSRVISDPSTHASKLLEKARQLTSEAARMGVVDITPREYTKEGQQDEPEDKQS